MMHRTSGGMTPYIEELIVEIVSKSEVCTCNLHTHKYITRYITHTRASDVCDCDGAKFGPHSGCAFYHYQLKVIARNESSSRTVCPDFAAARQSPVGEIAPVFVCQRVAFPGNAKSFPPVLGIKCEPLLAGIFAGKHQQFKSTLSEIGR